MKKILLAVLTMLASLNLSYAQNAIYMKQIGSASNIELEQIGSNNNIGSLTEYSQSVGSTNNVTVRQTGSQNTNKFNIQGSTNVYESITGGDSNQTTLVCGDSIVSCTSANITEAITGNLNIVSQTIKGQNITSSLAITGSSNQVTTNITQSNSTSNIAITGDANSVNSTMNATSGSGSTLGINIMGSSNTILTTQGGSIDSTVKLQVTGTSNNVTVHTGN